MELVPSHLIAWMKMKCTALFRCLITKDVVLIKLLPTDIYYSLEVIVRLKLMLPLKVFELIEEVLS